MKIGILTHPLVNNYGGVLQAYALQTYLCMQGHEVLVLNRQRDIADWKRFILFFLKLLRVPKYYGNSGKSRDVIMKFIKKRINRTQPVYSSCKMTNLCRKKRLDAVIVGSDQVWRNDFVTAFGKEGLSDFFLNFVPDSALRIAYAASFGIDEWGYTLEQTAEIKKMMPYFKAVSVRESSAVDLCKVNMEVNAVHVLDPTMLHTSEVYDEIASKRLVGEKYIFVYWLGDKIEAERYAKRYVEQGYTVVKQFLRDLDTRQISVEDWLSFIKYADRVITDSFHGCVFSILYHRQFSVYKNDSGGNDRLLSLFKMLGLENLLQEEELIDYEKIDTFLAQWRVSSKNFLKKALGD